MKIIPKYGIGSVVDSIGDWFVDSVKNVGETLGLLPKKKISTFPKKRK